eukprot:scaffold17718_cov109-Isochrysis_galbana.AAC.8
MGLSYALHSTTGGPGEGGRRRRFFFWRCCTRHKRGPRVACPPSIISQPRTCDSPRRPAVQRADPRPNTDSLHPMCPQKRCTRK